MIIFSDNSIFGFVRIFSISLILSRASSTQAESTCEILLRSIWSNRCWTTSILCLMTARSILGLIAKYAGAREMRMSMASPTHFWPSLDPWAKLTNALDAIRVVLIQVFGYLFQNLPGCWKKSWFLIYICNICMAPKARKNHATGDASSDFPASITFAHGILTPVGSR